MKIRLLQIFILSLITFLTFAQQAQVKETKIEVTLGIDKIMKVDFVPYTRAQIADESVVGLQFIPQKKEITIKGKKPGRSSITIRDRSGNVRVRYLVNVTATEKSKVIGELNDLIGDVEGINIGLKGGKVYVGGKIIVPGDIGKVVIILEEYKEVLNLIEVSPQTYQIIARKMQEGMRRNNLRDVTVRFFNNSYILEGIVNSDAEKDLAFKIAAAYLPDRIESLARRADAVQRPSREEIIKNFVVVNRKQPPPPADKLIKITAQFVELTKDYSKIFGFKWSPTLGGDGGTISFGKTSGGTVTTNSSGTLSGTISNLFPKLNSAKAAGYARVVQSGVVIIKDKKQGQLTKGSTKNTQLGSGEFAQPTSIKAGFNLTIRPTILQEEKINLEVTLSVNTAVGNDTQDNTVKTELIVKSKESAVVGGVSVNKSATEYDKDPPGGADTVDAETGFPIFSFVRSKEVTKSKEQFVVFITPEIIESAASGTEEIKRKFRKRGR
jgi:pilus assembly protein CpaC